MAGPARDTSTPWLRGLRSRPTFTGTGLAQPKTPAPASDSSAGTISVPTGSTCTTGFRVSRPARFAVSSPNALATQPCDTSCRMIDGTMTQKMMISCSVMLWWAIERDEDDDAGDDPQACASFADPSARLPEEAPGGRT